MKSTFVVIFSLIFINLCVYGQKNDLKNLNLKGDVKLIQEFHYQPTEQNGQVIKEGLDFYFHNYFNDDGNKIEDIRYAPDGSIDKKYIYNYDSLGRRIDQHQYASDESLIRKIIYVYDNMGNLAEDISYNARNEFEKKFTYVYDADGRLIEDYSFDKEGNLLKRFVYVYNNACLRIENKRYSSQGELERQICFVYDSYGSVIEEVVSSSDGTQTIYTYEYDPQKNWIKKVSFINNKPTIIIERKIEYY